MIEVKGKVEDVPPNGNIATNIQEFKLGDEHYLAAITHYQSGNFTSTTVRFFKEVKDSGFSSSFSIPKDSSVALEVKPE